MKRFVASLIDIRKGEWTLTLLMFLYLYLIMVGYYFLKPARDSLFLVNLGLKELPFVFILIAVVVAPVTSVYARLGRRLKMTQLINGTTLVFVLCLLALRWLVRLETAWVYYAFYIWVSIYGVLMTSQFWLFANAVFHASQAKRLFVLLTLGAIIGAFTGGEVTGLLIEHLGIETADLLLACAGLLVCCMFLLNIIWTIRQRDPIAEPARGRERERRKESMGEMYATIRRSRHLLFIVGHFPDKPDAGLTVGP